MESEKASYTLNHATEAAENENGKIVESYEPLDEDAKESDKMLKQEKNEEKPLIVEVKIENDEKATPEEKEALKVENQSSKPNTTKKNKILQLFEWNKNKSDNGEAKKSEDKEPENETTTDAPPKPKRNFMPLPKLPNPFAKRTENNDTSQIENANTEEKKDETKDVEEKPQNKSKLGSIHFPQISGIFNRFRKTAKSDDIELGPQAAKAGLASMETLDDSTKDPWNQEEQDAVDAAKLAETVPDEKKPIKEEEGEKNLSVYQQIRNYNCSIDDIALIAGVIVFLILVALILAFTFWGSAKQSRSAPIHDGKCIAVTSCGPVEGLYEDSAIAFRGIPYAKPPIGNKRFEPAELINDIDFCWNGTLKAHNATPVCMQEVDGSIVGVEDCLTLDIITPEVRYINLLPVIVMIGSNSYIGGAPGILRPSPRYARSRDVIFVRPNFRLNALGFLAHESLSSDSPISTSGNYALTDIIAALEWIQNNIRNFGGDPDSVTLFGHRTGATLVTALSSSSKANKLFTRAWVSSGSYHLPGKSLIESERESELISSNITSDRKSFWYDLDSMENTITNVPNSWKLDLSSTLPGKDENSANLHDWLVLDGVVLKKHPQDAWQSNEDLSSKLVIGTTAHAAFDYSKSSFLNANLTIDEIKKFVNDSKIGELGLTEDALKKYGETVQGLIAMISDIRVVCPLLVLARSQKTNIPFYVVTQTEGNLNVADVDSDIQAILGRYTADSPEKRRYIQAIPNLFYYYVSHGKIPQYSSQNFVLNIGQDVIASSNYSHCDYWIEKNLVPHYALI